MASSSSDMRRALLAASVCAVLSALPAPSPAADDAATKRAAQAKLVEGVGLLKSRHFAAALERFEQAYALVPSPLIAYDFGLAHLGLGDSARALESFETFLGEARDAPVDKRRRAERYRDDLRARVTILELAADVATAELTVDGRSLGRVSFPKRLPVAPGSHDVVARVGERGGATHAATVTGGAGQTVQLALRLAAAPPPRAAATATPEPTMAMTGSATAAAPPELTARAPAAAPDPPAVMLSQPPRPPASVSPLRVGALSAAALGAVSLGVGFTFGAMAQGNGDALTDDSLNRRDFMPADEEAGLRNQRLQVLFLSVGAAAIVAGITLYAIARHREAPPGAP